MNKQIAVKTRENRRCGYLGCLDRTANLNVVNNWCEQMEWSSVRMNSISSSRGIYTVAALIITHRYEVSSRQRSIRSAEM